MTTREEQRKDDELATPKNATPLDAKTPANPAEIKKPAGYVFKFAPADPKNSFDFEDTADK